MSRPKNLKVRTKLIGGFLIVAAIAAIIGFMGMQSMQRISSMTDQLYENKFVSVRHAAEADRQLVSAGRALSQTLLTATEDDYRSEYFSIDNHFVSAKMALDDLERTVMTDDNKRSVQQARSAVNAFEKSAKDIVREQPAETLGRLDTTERIFKEMRPLADEAEGLIKRILYDQQDQALKATEEIRGIYHNALVVMGGLTGLGVLMAIGLGLLITRGFTRQLGAEPDQVAQIAGAIAKGKLNNTIMSRHTPKDSIMHAMAQMQDALGNVVMQVRNSSEHIAAGSGQIAAGNTDLSQRTEQQSANLTQTAAAMEELAGTVKSNADVARQAAHMASTASAAAVQGGEVVNNVVNTMQEINASSRKIVDIISVIDSIAFQTNILALNAAVEAARAGEQGRGFAVVASEVRGLAQKSASAAKDIKNLIDSSVQKVDAGTALVDEAGTAMNGIVTHVKQVTDLINEISAATHEQTQGINQVNEAVLQLSDVTQQNASLVQQSASAADSLRQQAGHLVDIVSVFDVGQGYIDVAAREIKGHGSAAQSAQPSAALPLSTPAQLPSSSTKATRSTPAARKDQPNTAVKAIASNDAGSKPSGNATPKSTRTSPPKRTTSPKETATGRSGSPASNPGDTPSRSHTDEKLLRPDLSHSAKPARNTAKEDDWEEF
ncbi:MAG: methyl-accepting chemotaxis protein [Alcaligenaceae bacterium]|nr:methyl-accepting chemotaxis protein [Alcaligenaceae bacterium]